MITLEAERAKLIAMDLRDPRILEQSHKVDRLILEEMKNSLSGRDDSDEKHTW